MDENKKKILIVVAIIAIIVLAIILIMLFSGKKEYTVSFESNGGTKVEEQIVKEGETATEPEEPTRLGYIFLGWYIDEETEDKFDFNTKITGNLTLLARWEQEEEEIQEVSIEADINEVNAGEELKLNLKVNSENPDLQDAKAVWTSSDETIATVSEEGIVKGLKAGTVTITVKVGEYTASFEVTVKEVETEEDDTEKVAENDKEEDKKTETKPESKPETKPEPTPEPEPEPEPQPEPTPEPEPEPEPQPEPTPEPEPEPQPEPTPEPEPEPEPDPEPTPEPEPEPEPDPEPTPEPEPEPEPEITYSYSWEKVDESVAGQYRLYIVSSKGEKVAGTATITTKAGKTTSVSIPKSGTIYVKDAISSVSNVKAN